MATKTIAYHKLSEASPGNERRLTAIGYGNRGTKPKAYIQAGIHADEAPGLLVGHHLIDLLDQADANGDISGEILLVPVANPIGIAQWRDNTLQGRFDFATGINFNRRHFDLIERVGAEIAPKLNADADQNVATIRAAMGTVLAEIQPQDETEYLKHLLLKLAHDADIVLDLHCDDQAIVHVYLGTPLWPDAADLPAQLGAAVTLLAKVSGQHPFDEACSRLWWDLAARFPQYPIPAACLAATVELRGISDVRHGDARRDALNIFHFLQRRGVIAGQAPPLPALINDATPLRGVEHVKAPVAGIVVYMHAPGTQVSAGDVVAEIVNPLAKQSADRVTAVQCTTSGTLFSTKTDRYARPGRLLVKIAGKTPISGKGDHLLTA